MIRIISYSGGLGSFAAAKLTRDKYGAENCVLLFADTLTEDEDLYRFVTETVAWLGIEFVRLCDGRNIWQVFSHEKFMGNSRVDPCSKHLKRIPLNRWCKQQYPDPSEAVRVVGIGAHEAHRLDAIRAAMLPYQVEAPLTDRITPQSEILDWLDEAGIEPPRLYALGFPHNNCGGFCVKTGQRQMALLLREFPCRYAWHEEMQENLFVKIGKHGTIKRTVKNTESYMTLKEFRLFVESNGQLDLYPEPGCGCVA